MKRETRVSRGAADLPAERRVLARRGWAGENRSLFEHPDNRITGGKIYSVRTRDVKSRVAEALRLAAQSLWHAQNYFGDLYRRWKARLGSPKAVTAMAHKLARILWHLLKYKQPYNPEVFALAQEKMKRKKLARLQNLAASLNYQLVPNQ